MVSVDTGFWDRRNDGRRIFALGRGLEAVEVSVTLDGALVGTDSGTVNGRSWCKDNDGSVLKGSETIVGGSRRKIFQDHMPGVPCFRCFFSAVRRVHHQEPVSEGRVREHHDNIMIILVTWLF